MKAILENHSLFSGDGESQMKNQELNTKAEQKDTNISLNNEDISNKNFNNIDLSNSTLGINDYQKSIKDNIQFWYDNVNQQILKEEQLLILEDQLFTSTLSNIVSKLRNNIDQIQQIDKKPPLIKIFDWYKYIVNDCNKDDEPFTGYSIGNEIMSVLLNTQ